MIILESIGYGYKDLTIVPSVISDIDHRNECNPFMENGCLPLFTSPMHTVVNEKNYDLWVNNKINAILPRTVPYKTRRQCVLTGQWVAFGKEEFNHDFVEYVDGLDSYGCKKYYVCLDNANGHMKSIYELCRKAKDIANGLGYEITIMVGNIANPETYDWICNQCKKERYPIVDYVRVGIGSGKGCLTSTHTAVHYPMATLVDKCKEYKNDYESTEFYGYTRVPAIVADGGIRGYDDIITALALGADYVMVGSVFTALQESAGETVNIEGKSYKEFFGMSTRKAQKLINATAMQPKNESDLELKTSEGTIKYLELGTSVDRWVRNFIDYLRSAMSYTNCETIKDFNNNVYLVVNSTNSQNAINR